MKRQARFAVATVALLAVTLVGSACSGDEVPPDSILTPSSSPSESSPNKPRMTEIAKQKSIPGARAFTEYYYSLVEYGHTTGKWKHVKELSRDCDVCQLFWTEHESLFKKNEDILIDIGIPDDLGIRNGEIEVDVGVEVGEGLEGAESHTERIQSIEKMWSDQVTISYDHGWRVVKIEPDQLEPSDSCIASRCRDFQKNRAEGSDAE